MKNKIENFSKKQILKLAKIHISGWDTFIEKSNKFANKPEVKEYLEYCKSVRALWQSILDKEGQNLTEEEMEELKASIQDIKNAKSN